MSDVTQTEFLEAYGSVKVKFNSYYKYTFTFTGTLDDGKTISVEFGGNSADIYRQDIVADIEVTVDSLEPYMGTVYADKAIVATFYDYQ